MNANTSAKSNQNTKPKEEPLIDVVPTNSNSSSRNTNSNTSRPKAQSSNSNTSILDTTPTKTSPTTTVTTPKVSSSVDTTTAYNLLQQKQYDAALKEAKRIIALDPTIQEAWKIAGFSEFNLKQYKEAASDLQKALDLQRASKDGEDPNTVDALAQAYARSEQFDKALPLLVKLTSKADAKPDAGLLYLRGLCEYRTGKPADAEKSFNASVKADPKNSASLYYLGLIAFERNDFSAAIAAFQRTTQADPKMAAAWERLAISYLQRAAIVSEEDETKAKADYQSAISAAEGLIRANPSNEATTLLGQALVSAGNYQRAAIELEKISTAPTVKAETLYLLGVSYSRLNQFPKAVATLERAGVKNPKDANIFRELGYAYEKLKQYAKAIEAYEKGAKADPNDTFFTDRINQLKPFAKRP
jgi:tetratricopeptide (TPR) repeat protein